MLVILADIQNSDSPVIQMKVVKFDFSLFASRHQLRYVAKMISPL